LNIAGGSSPIDQTGSIDVCTYATTTNYRIEINSQGAGHANAVTTSAFDAAEAGGTLMPYSVAWSHNGQSRNFNDNASNSVRLPSGNQIDPTCGGGTNTTISVTIAAADFNAAIAGTYADTLDVVITAQ
jgi:hypothetical protein